MNWRLKVRSKSLVTWSDWPVSALTYRQGRLEIHSITLKCRPCKELWQEMHGLSALQNQVIELQVPAMNNKFKGVAFNVSHWNTLMWVIGMPKPFSQLQTYMCWCSRYLNHGPCPEGGNALLGGLLWTSKVLLGTGLCCEMHWGINHFALAKFPASRHAHCCLPPMIWRMVCFTLLLMGWSGYGSQPWNLIDVLRSNASSW